MNLAKSLTGLAFAPVRAGLAVADAGITVATGALDLAHRTVGEEKDGVRTGRPTSMAQVLGIEARMKAFPMSNGIVEKPRRAICTIVHLFPI